MFNKKNKRYNATDNSKNNNEDFKSIYGIYADNPTGKPKTKKTVKNRNSGVVYIYVLFFMLCCIYIIGYTYGFVTKKIVNHDVIQLGVIDTPKTVQGVIIRDEVVYSANADGVISYEVADNEKVKKNSVICTIKDADIVAGIESELEEIDESILKIQSERDDISIYYDDIQQDNQEIMSLINDNAMDYGKNNFGGIYELKNNIQKKMDTRNELLLTENKGTLTEYVSQRNQQLEKLNSSISRITVEDGGIISYNIDGLEDKYTIEGLSQYTKDDTTVTNSTVSSFKTNVNADEPAFKLVRSNVWYVAAYVPTEYTRQWEQGNLIWIYSKDSLGKSHDLTAEIYELQGSESDSERYTVFRITKDMTDFINERSISFDVEKATSGYKIPNTAIVEETLLKVPLDYVNTEDLYVTKADNTRVNIIISDKDEEENIAYIPVQLGTLNVGDTLRKPFTEDTYVIQDVLNTQGIYVINTGYAEFKRIYMENSVSNNTHTILDTSINTNINIYDRIVTDSDTVEREEKVYR